MGVQVSTLEALRATRNGFAAAAGLFGIWIFDASTHESMNDFAQTSAALMIGAAATQVVVGTLQLRQEQQD